MARLRARDFLDGRGDETRPLNPSAPLSMVWQAGRSQAVGGRTAAAIAAMNSRSLLSACWAASSRDTSVTVTSRSRGGPPTTDRARSARFSWRGCERLAAGGSELIQHAKEQTCCDDADDGSGEDDQHQELQRTSETRLSGVGDSVRGSNAGGNHEAPDTIGAKPLDDDGGTIGG
jgi:hypothetical protein